MTATLRGVLTPISFNRWTNNSRSSVSTIALTGVPSTFILCFSNTPLLSSSTPQFNAVWPPNVSSIPSGFSFSITFSTYSGVIGRKYILSARSLEVWIVAMFGLISTVLIFSSFRAFNACEPLKSNSPASPIFKLPEPSTIIFLGFLSFMFPVIWQHNKYCVHPSLFFVIDYRS